MHITAYDSPQAHCDRLNSRVKEHTAALTGKGSFVRAAVCSVVVSFRTVQGRRHLCAFLFSSFLSTSRVSHHGPVR